MLHRYQKETNDNNESHPLESLFSQTARLHRSHIHTLLHTLGLHRGQPPILYLLWEKDGVTQKEISEKIGLTPASITDTLQRMEKAGFLERKTDIEDQRISRVYITEKGYNVKKEVDHIFKSLEEELFRDFTLEEKVLLRRFFIQMKENLIRISSE